jgi:hypothetical protein
MTKEQLGFLAIEKQRKMPPILHCKQVHPTEIPSRSTAIVVYVQVRTSHVSVHKEKA